MPEPGRDAWWGMASVQENKPADVFPKTIIVNDGAYSSQTNGEYTATGAFYSGYPVYKGPGSSTKWSVYVRGAGYAEGKWVLDFSAVDDEWDGTVNFWENLYADKV